MQKFLEALKERASFFLIEMGQFKPFSAIVQVDGEIKDIINDSQSYSLEIIYELLLKNVQQDLKNNNIKASAIVLTGKADGYDVVVIEIFTNLQEKYQAVFPYAINGEIVTFGTDLNKGYHTNTER
ncbi:hypothetical protein [Chryseobacterium viscerum]|uniref:Uncharacterized protein n=1 Tax=Chryseobacterium viscerum TaxID=1037377 RepID=A0A316WYT1_9FLAO|nr:hypothetical protein [Chryseobacterium viscerum]PWN64148.1 hypothetical protein C1634_006020 [Chryseobacterium viscerum]